MCLFTFSIKTEPNNRPNPDTLSKYSSIVEHDPIDQTSVAGWLQNRLEMNGRR